MSDGTEFSREMRQKRENYFEDLGDEEGLNAEDAEVENIISKLEEARGKISEIIDDPKVARYIQKLFKIFLITFRDENQALVYESRINEMCSNNTTSIEITYSHLNKYYHKLAFWTFECPSYFLKEFNKVAYNLATRYFPGFKAIHSEIFVKIGDFPLEEKIRDLRTPHLNTLIKVRGVISKRYPVYSQMKEVTLLCRCGEIRGPIFESDFSKPNLSNCPSCGFKGPYKIHQEKTLYKSF